MDRKARRSAFDLVRAFAAHPWNRPVESHGPVRDELTHADERILQKEIESLDPSVKTQSAAIGPGAALWYNVRQILN